MAVTREEIGYIQRFRETGDRAAFGRLFAAYKDRAYALALVTVRSQHDALGVVQDAFSEAYRTLSGLRSDEAFSAWFCRIVIYRCNRVLQKHNDTLLSEDAGQFIAQIPGEALGAYPDAKLDQAAAQRLLFEAITKLPPTQRVCVMLYYYDDLTVSEIAAVMNCSQGAIKSRLNYARIALRRMLRVEESDSRSLGGFIFMSIPLPAVSAQRVWRSLQGELMAEATTAAVSAGSASGGLSPVAALSAALGGIAAVAGLFVGGIALSRGPATIPLASPPASTVLAAAPSPRPSLAFMTKALPPAEPDEILSLDASPEAIPLAPPPVQAASSTLPVLGMSMHPTGDLPLLLLGAQDVSPYLDLLGESSVSSLMDRFRRLGLTVDYRASAERVAVIESMSMDDWYNGASSPLSLGGLRAGERLDHVFSRYDEASARIAQEGRYTVYAFAGLDGSELRVTTASIVQGDASDEDFRTRLLSLIIKKIEIRRA